MFFLTRMQKFWALPRTSGVLASLITATSFLLSCPALSAQSIQQPESEVGIVAASTVGSLHIFGYAGSRQLDFYGAQYTRHSWGGFLSARVDYMTEILPVVLLHEPKFYRADSTPLTTQRKTVYGAGVSPIGIQLLWRRNKTWRPYLMGDGGVLYFKDRVLSTQGTHLNFSAETGVGFEFATSPQTNLRVGYSWFHFSNGDIAARNPGLDSNLIYAVFRFNLPGSRIPKT